MAIHIFFVAFIKSDYVFLLRNSDYEMCYESINDLRFIDSKQIGESSYN